MNDLVEFTPDTYVYVAFSLKARDDQSLSKSTLLAKFTFPSVEFILITSHVVSKDANNMKSSSGDTANES